MGLDRHVLRIYKRDVMDIQCLSPRHKEVACVVSSFIFMFRSWHHDSNIMRRR